MKQDKDARIVFCTCPTEEVGKAIAGMLVQRRLAACVNIIDGLTSIYEWQGKTESDSECQLIIKTTVNCLDALEAAITEQHPYELPELIAVPVSEGSAGYMDWIRKNTQ